MSIKEFDNILGIVAHYERCMCQGIIKAIDDRSLVMCDTCKTTSRVKNLKKNVNCIVRVDNESYSLKASVFSDVIHMTMNEIFVTDKKDISEKLTNSTDVNIKVRSDEIVSITTENVLSKIGYYH